MWFDFKCKNCGEVRENVAASIEDKIQKCPSCGGESVRQISSPTLKFKGGGWTTRKPVEAFPGESEYVEDWGHDSHGMGSDPGSREE